MATSFSTALSSGATAAAAALDQAGAQAGTPKGKIVKAAQDFEALLLGQVLKSVHQEGGWLGSGSDDASDAAVGLGEEQLARVMAATGGLGLSKLIEAGLRNEEASASTIQMPPGDQANTTS
jgi:Rod binding domain-containing protein